MRLGRWRGAALIAATALAAGTLVAMGSVTAAGAALARTNTEWTVTVTPSPAVQYQTVTFRATLTTQYDPAKPPTGTVTFWNDRNPGCDPNKPSCTAPDKVGSAEVQHDSSHVWAEFPKLYSDTTYYSHLYAGYSGDANYLNDWTSYQTFEVKTLETTTTVASNASSIDMSQSLHVSAHVAVASGSTVHPDGAVTFSFTGVGASGPDQAAGLDGNGDAAVDIPAEKFTAGRWVVQASYKSTNKPSAIGASKSDALPLEFNLAAATTTVTADKPSATAGEQVTFKATVTGSGTAPTGTVTFSVDGNDGTQVSLDKGPLNISSATWATSDLPAGDHQVIAYYSSSGTYLAGASSPVTAKIVGLPSTTTVKTDHAQAAPAQNVTFAVSVAGDGDTPSGRVTVLVDGKAVATPLLDAQGKATWSTHTLRVGAHQIVVRFAGDNRYAASQSMPVKEQIAVPTGPTSGWPGTTHGGRSVKAPTRPALAGLPMLPKTGSVTATLLSLASALLVAGAALVLLGRRRRQMSRRHV